MNIPFKNPLVVGYKGEIGSFILQCLLKVMPKALNIWCFDINESEASRIARIKRSDYIFLCVPLRDTTKWLVRYKKYLKGKKIVEQCSLKSFLYEDKRFKDLELIGMHLLFRPSGTPDPADRECIVIMDRQLHPGASLDWWENFIMTVQEMTKSVISCYPNYKAHDEAMATLQAVTHRVILTLGELISTESTDGSTYVTRRVMELVKRIEAGNYNLYKRIQDNEHLPKPLKKFKRMLNKFELKDYIEEDGS